MKREYAAFFFVWALGSAAGEAVAPSVPWQAWLGWYVLLAVVEAVGLRRAKPGDTFSETMWLFGRWGLTRPGWARGLLLIGVATMMALRVYSIPLLARGASEPWMMVAPWTAVCGGFGAWLIVHFFRHGTAG